jgi:inosine/xanthosine triphosphate pyrophosphatase family protein
VIRLVTSNIDKYAPYEARLRENDIVLTRPEGETEEIQTMDADRAVVRKAQSVFALYGSPVIVDDAALLLDAYAGFPGTMTKNVMRLVRLAGLERLLSGLSPLGEMVCKLGLCLDGAAVKIFTGTVRGKLDFSAPRDGGLPLNSVFFPEGARGSLGWLAEHDPEFPTHRSLALEEALSWISQIQGEVNRA